jgi:hypothetical protein
MITLTKAEVTDIIKQLKQLVDASENYTLALLQKRQQRTGLKHLRTPLEVRNPCPPLPKACGG